MPYSVSSVLAFVEAAPVAPMLFLAIVDCLIWLLFGEFVILPWMDEQFAGKRPWWKRALMWPVDQIKGRVKKLLNRIKSEMSHRFLMAEPGIARWLHRHALIIESLSGTIVASNEAALEAFSYLRHTTIPTLIAQALRSPLQRITTLEARVGAIITELTDVKTQLRTMLRALPWGGATVTTAPWLAFFNSYRHLWDQFFNVAQPRLNQLWTDRVQNVRQRLERLETQVTTIREEALPAIRQRLGRIETWIEQWPVQTIAQLDALIPVSLIGLVALQELTRLRPNLFCRNVTTITEQACAMDENMLSQLLAGTLLFAIALDPRVIARIGQELTEDMAGLFSEIAIR